jgi:hypothetical protein
LAETRRERSTPAAVRDEAVYYALRRCCRPGCRRRDELELHAVSPGRGRPGLGEVVVLCADCHRRARRGAYSRLRLQRWKLRTVEYFEDVGAE